MARGKKIIVSTEPKGQRLEGVILGTPKPGTIMEQTSAALVSGRHTYQAVTRASGAKGPIYVLLEDELQGIAGIGAALAAGGHSPAGAYISGSRGFLYAPIMGEDLNLIVGSQTGTADDVAKGDLLGVETVTGKLIKNNSFASAPFQAQEAMVDPTADTSLWVTYLGNLA